MSQTHYEVWDKSRISQINQWLKKGMVVDAVWREPVSGRFPCLTGKKQGILKKLALFEPVITGKQLELLSFLENSLRDITGNLKFKIGKLFWETGK
ncbi:MAG: hypothetical protein E2O36_02905 [Proteobacteria bacterium]|nr:MAG: hypothetical protein E2O36_02905 [Pseudomonadota bacterium]